MDSIDITPTKGFPHMYDFIGDKVTKGSPVVLVVLTFVIIIYYCYYSLLLNSCNYYVFINYDEPIALSVTITDIIFVVF